jgi:hypothetical protein
LYLDAIDCRRDLRFLQLSKYALDGFEIAPSCLGQRDPTRRSMEQFDVEPLFDGCKMRFVAIVGDTPSARVAAERLPSSATRAKNCIPVMAVMLAQGLANFAVVNRCYKNPWNVRLFTLGKPQRPKRQILI